MTTRTIPIAPDVRRIAARIPDEAVVGTSRDALAAAVATIAARFRPERIVLFGSRADGEPRADSDVDLMVVMETPLPRTRQADLIREAVTVGPTARLHPTVCTPDEIRVGLAEGDFFILDAIGRGSTLFVTDEVGERTATMPSGPRGADAADREPSRPKRASLAWLAKAEADDRMAERAALPPDPLWEGVCFHAQQSAEKHLTALLQELDERPSRSHDLAELSDLASLAAPEPATLREDLVWLTDYAVAIRYPAAVAGQPEAARALGIAADVRRQVRAALGLADR